MWDGVDAALPGFLVARGDLRTRSVILLLEGHQVTTCYNRSIIVSGSTKSLRRADDRNDRVGDGVRG